MGHPLHSRHNITRVGELNLALRREYNAKLQAHRDGAAHLSGGGKTSKWVKDKMNALLRPFEERIKELETQVEELKDNKANITYVNSYADSTLSIALQNFNERFTEELNTIDEQFKDEREAIIRFIAKDIVRSDCLQGELRK